MSQAGNYPDCECCHYKMEYDEKLKSTNPFIPKLLGELENIRDSLDRHPDVGGSSEIERLNTVISQLRAGA